jgi:hypothetical protein
LPHSLVRTRRWSPGVVRSARFSVEVWCAAIPAQAMTVLPALAGAASTPASARKPAESAVTSVTGRIGFHLLCPWQIG